MTREQKEAKIKRVKAIYKEKRFRNLEPKRRQLAKDRKAFTDLLKAPLKIN